MSKNANPVSYAGRKADKTKSGQVRFSTNTESVAGTKDNVSVSPLSLVSKMAAPGAIGATTPAAGTFTTVTLNTGLSVDGGAVTNSIGQATLVLGTATILNTNITASSRIFLTRRGANASTALGELNVSAITASTSFVITSQDLVTPANTATGDISTVDYFIVEQV